MPSFLNQRYFKLPVWVWIVIGGTIIGLGLRYYKSQQVDTSGEDTGNTGTETSAVPGDTTGTGDSSFIPAFAQPIDNGSAGFGADTSPQSQIPPELLDAFTSQQDLITTLITAQVTPGSQCGPGTVWDDAAGRCKPVVTAPPSGSTYCGPGTKWDPAKGRCVLTGTGGTTTTQTHNCPAGKRWDPARGVCTSCKAGTTWDPIRKVCSKCPHGTTWNGRKCVTPKKK